MNYIGTPFNLNSKLRKYYKMMFKKNLVPRFLFYLDYISTVKLS